MRTYSFIAVVISLMVVNAQATTTNREAPMEVVCECLNTYVRLSFEAVDGLLTNIKVINSSSNNTCDEWHIRHLTSSTTANHPDGVIAVGVTGYKAKDKTMSYEQCLKTDEVELDLYWFVEDVLIDLEKINKKE